MNRRSIKMEHPEATAKIFGSFDRNAAMIEAQFGVTVRNRAGDGGDSIVIEGENAEAVNAAAQCVTYLHELCSKTDELSEQSVQYAIDMVTAGQGAELEALGDACICVTAKGKPSGRNSMWRASARIQSSSASVLPEREKPFLRSRWRSRRCGKSRSAA